MNFTSKCLVLITTLAFLSCGGKEEKKEQVRLRGSEAQKKNISDKEESTIPNKGIGPVKNLTLDTTTDDAMALEGEALFKKNCTACHSPDQKLIGPAPKGILDRRTPEWVMNMILNPGVMLKQDPTARQLLIDNNNIPMINQNLKEEEARKILEYFRTL